MYLNTNKFVIGILAVGLIFLITVQLMMEFDKTRIYLNWVEGQVSELFNPEVRKVSVVSSDDYVVIELLNSGIYSEARILRNNEKAYYFQNSMIRIPVFDQDLLILDTRGIDKALWFEVIEISENITSLNKGQQFRVKDGVKTITIDKRDTYKY